MTGRCAAGARRRRTLFEQIDRPALLPLPPAPYEYAEWKRCRVNLDYHVEIGKHFYSVPFQLLRQEVEARITAKTVEIFHRGKLVAAHLRSLRRHRPSTVPEHMPSSHRRYRDWTHERIQREAAAIGDDTAALIELILRSRPHPEQGFRSCIGILGLAEALRRRAAGRRLRPGARARHPLVQLGRRDPEEPAGGEAEPRTIRPACSTRTSAVPATTTEGESMLIHPMAERLRGLGLTAMADAFIDMQNNSTADDLSREDWLGLLLDREATSRENKRLGRRLRQARLRQNAIIEDTDFRAPRGLDRALFQKLATLPTGSATISIW